MDLRQASNKKKYDLAASVYDFIAFAMSLGQAQRIYKTIADTILDPSGTIVELGCGPASAIRHIARKADPGATVIGVDFSPRMIDIANNKKAENNWSNVQFECMDIYDFPQTQYADTVIFCLALTAIPNATKALGKALDILRPGGQLIIVDSIPLDRNWWHPITNAYIFLKSLVVGAKPTADILPFIQKHMTDVQTEEMLCGIYTVISARLP